MYVRINFSLNSHNGVMYLFIAEEDLGHIKEIIKKIDNNLKIIDYEIVQ